MCGAVAELVDAMDCRSVGEIREGSSPSSPTQQKQKTTLLKGRLPRNPLDCRSLSISVYNLTILKCICQVYYTKIENISLIKFIP